MTSTKYAKYLKSEHWQEVKKKNTRRRCWCCRRKIKNPQIHHKTYIRLGKEKNRDLVSVCPHCHLEIHDLVKTKRCKLSYAHKHVRRIFTEYKYLNQLCYAALEKQSSVLIIFLEQNGYLVDSKPTQLAKFEGLVWEHGKTWIWHKYKVLKLFKEANPEYSWYRLYQIKVFKDPKKIAKVSDRLQTHLTEDENSLYSSLCD